MPESVETGGMMKFDYDKGKTPQISQEMKSEISKGYEDADVRKKREKIYKILAWVLSIVFLGVVLYLIL